MDKLTPCKWPAQPAAGSFRQESSSVTRPEHRNARGLPAGQAFTGHRGEPIRSLDPPMPATGLLASCPAEAAPVPPQSGCLPQGLGAPVSPGKRLSQKPRRGRQHGARGVSPWGENRPINLPLFHHGGPTQVRASPALGSGRRGGFGGLDRSKGSRPWLRADAPIRVFLVSCVIWVRLRKMTSSVYLPRRGC